MLFYNTVKLGELKKHPKEHLFFNDVRKCLRVRVPELRIGPHKVGVFITFPWLTAVRMKIVETPPFQTSEFSENATIMHFEEKMWQI